MTSLLSQILSIKISDATDDITDHRARRGAAEPGEAARRHGNVIGRTSSHFLLLLRTETT